MVSILESRRESAEISARERKRIDLRRLFPGRVNCKFDNGRFGREAILATSSGGFSIRVGVAHRLRGTAVAHACTATTTLLQFSRARTMPLFLRSRDAYAYIYIICIYTRRGKVDGRQTRLHDRREDIVVHRSRTMSMTYSSDERRCESIVSSMKMFLQAFLSSLLPTLP